MKAALLAKFNQNPGLLSLLQGTGDRELVDITPGDYYWGAGTKGKGKNRLGALLMEVRKELKDVRVDETLLANQPRVEVMPNLEVDNAAAADDQEVVADAKEIVQEATGGVVKLIGTEQEQTVNPVQGQQGGGGVSNSAGGVSNPAGGVSNPAGGGGIFMFINPKMGDSVEAKARRARHHAHRAFTWEGQQGGAEGNTMAAYEAAAQDGGAELVVEKLGA